MKQKQIGFEVNHNEVYRCNKCGGAAWRVVWLSTGRRTITMEWVFVYCPTCDELRRQKYK
ncbi:hypothetical protein F0720_26565 [Bacillus anthracis]|uniref:Conserved domain protein n=1 Tax=Bacillus anthracis TaxID=1392 RepID=A0A6L7HC49_BACAN|nr:hypothetical protein BX_B0092 [Bacillus anthracis str. A2012]AAT29022.2 conserved domain protein [Bacillus anthracis str. 'Ames Ancestor']ACP12065.1 conserved domain protein [Bacillus anthracis str. CDC 684]ACQ45925.1 conserved domain protein [Bacillus anthracis str. A0248]AFH87157.1 hypothetical protein H9401_5772 [Bacillus anthracis str. H9401]AHE93306.1 hypothetical protein A16_60920 [Bacillus anthracis str. A16]AHK41915.1 hypothetical protein BAPAT_pXO20093 [Bacillus anthracis str. SVA